MSTAESKAKNIIIYLIPSFLNNVLPFATFPIITRFLTPSDFGIIALATSTTLLLAHFLACNVDSATQLYYFKYRKGDRDLEELINTSLAFLVVAFLLFIPAVYFFSGVISRIAMGTSEYKFAVFVTYLSACLSIISNFYLLIYRNMERAKMFSLFTTIQMTVNIFLTLTFIVIFKLGYLGLIYASFFSWLIVAVLLFFSFAREFPFRFSFKKLKENLLYGIPLLPNLFTGSITQFFDKYMLRSIVSLASTGLFSVAQNVTNKLFVFMTAVQSTFDPLFMKDMFDKGEGGAKSLGRNFTVFTYISLSLLLFIVLFAEEIIYILAPSNYYPAINVMLVLLCAISTQTFGKISGTQLAYAKKAYFSFPLSILEMVIIVLLNLMLIPRWGAFGAALATLVSMLGMNGIYVYVAQRYYRIIYEKKILLFIYINIFVSAAALVYFRIIGATVVLKYILKCLSLIMFLLIGINADIINKKNINIILNILKFKKTAEAYVEL